jgi:hypothetical protein
LVTERAAAEGLDVKTFDEATLTLRGGIGYGYPVSQPMPSSSESRLSSSLGPTETGPERSSQFTSSTPLFKRASPPPPASGLALAVGLAAAPALAVGLLGSP